MSELFPRVVGLGLILACLLPQPSEAAEPSPERRFGIALNGSVNGEVPLRLVPTAILLVGKNQLEAGVGIHPFIHRDHRVVSVELNYKYFPNGLENAISPYLVGQLAYARDARKAYYPTTYHFMFLNGGYGLMLSGDSRTYLGTNVSIGPYARIRRSENPYPGFDSDGLVDDVGFNLAFQLNVGYRI